MKSDKAKQFLDTKQPGDIAQYEVSMSKAEKAVEIAEAEICERAIEAHFTACLSRDGGKCKQWGFWNVPCNRECDFMKSFIKQLEKEEKPWKK